MTLARRHSCIWQQQVITYGPLLAVLSAAIKAMAMRHDRSEPRPDRSGLRWARGVAGHATPRSAIQIDSYTFRLLFGEGLRGAGDVIEIPCVRAAGVTTRGKHLSGNPGERPCDLLWYRHRKGGLACTGSGISF
jgi:hypothetical protein